MQLERRPQHGWLPGLLCVVAFLLDACGGADRERAAVVFAASSLTEVFQSLAVAFESENPGTEIRLHFAGTPQLTLQLREGARADLFASADLHQMDAARQSGSVRGTPVVFARNQLAIVTEAGNPDALNDLGDLVSGDLRVLLCGPSVPAGRYARDLLARAGLELRPVSEEPNVKSVVQKIALGEADAGIVYRTDVFAAGDGISSIDIPPASNIDAAYPMALVAADDQDSVAARFRTFTLSDRGRAILEQHGFLSP